MTSEAKAPNAEVTAETVRDPWVTPEILSFEAVEVTKANTIKPGDTLSSLS